MTAVKKVIINITTLYGKIIINAFVALLTTSILLSTLGESDYGLFSLITGVVVMLSFLNSALLSSTQRFLSIAIGQKDIKQQQLVFNSSLILHIAMAMLFIILFKAIQPLLFNGFLNIPEDKEAVAIQAYNVIIWIMVITFLTVPYDAVINAREDMWFFAVVDIVMSLLKLAAAVIITYVESTTLLFWYVMMILFVTILCFFVKVFWCMRMYSETKIKRNLLFNKVQIKKQLEFTGWNTLVSFATVGRNQGITVVLNLFFGTIMNAAYGIVNQVNGIVVTFSSTISTVFAPQIIQSKGANNNDRMMKIATFSTKITFFLSSFIGLPLLIQTETILHLWINNVPEYTVYFCKITILTFIVVQMYPGLLRTLYAYGKIKWYQIIISSLILTSIPVGYIGYKFFDAPPQFILYCMLIAEILSLSITVYFVHLYLGLALREYFIGNILKPVAVFAFTYFTSELLLNLISYGLILNLVVSCMYAISIFSFMFYVYAFNQNEKSIIQNILSKIIHKIIVRKHTIR